MIEPDLWQQHLCHDFRPAQPAPEAVLQAYRQGLHLGVDQVEVDGEPTDQILRRKDRRGGPWRNINVKEKIELTLESPGGFNHHNAKFNFVT